MALVEFLWSLDPACHHHVVELSIINVFVDTPESKYSIEIFKTHPKYTIIF